MRAKTGQRGSTFIELIMVCAILAIFGLGLRGLGSMLAGSMECVWTRLVAPAGSGASLPQRCAEGPGRAPGSLAVLEPVALEPVALRVARDGSQTSLVGREPGMPLPVRKPALESAAMPPNPIRGERPPRGAPSAPGASDKSPSVALPLVQRRHAPTAQLTPSVAAARDRLEQLARQASSPTWQGRHRAVENSGDTLDGLGVAEAEKALLALKPEALAQLLLADQQLQATRRIDPEGALDAGLALSRNRQVSTTVKGETFLQPYSLTDQMVDTVRDPAAVAHLLRALQRASELDPGPRDALPLPRVVRLPFDQTDWHSIISRAVDPFLRENETHPEKAMALLDFIIDEVDSEVLYPLSGSGRFAGSRNTGPAMGVVAAKVMQSFQRPDDLLEAVRRADRREKLEHVFRAAMQARIEYTYNIYTDGADELEGTADPAPLVALLQRIAATPALDTGPYSERGYLHGRAIHATVKALDHFVRSQPNTSRVAGPLELHFAQTQYFDDISKALAKVMSKSSAELVYYGGKHLPELRSLEVATFYVLARTSVLEPTLDWLGRWRADQVARDEPPPAFAKGGDLEGFMAGLLGGHGPGKERARYLIQEWPSSAPTVEVQKPDGTTERRPDTSGFSIPPGLSLASEIAAQGAQIIGTGGSIYETYTRQLVSELSQDYLPVAVAKEVGCEFIRNSHGKTLCKVGFEYLKTGKLRERRVENSHSVYYGIYGDAVVDHMLPSPADVRASGAVESAAGLAPENTPKYFDFAQGFARIASTRSNPELRGSTAKTIRLNGLERLERDAKDLIKSR